MKKLILGLLLICSVNVLEASSSQQINSGEVGDTSSGMTVGYNPADFTIVGTSLPGTALTDMVVTGLQQVRCSSYTVVASEDPRLREEIEKEIEFSSGEYADPSGRLTPNILAATHMVKGDAIFKQGSVSINLRIEDRHGCVWYQAKVSGSETSFFKLTDEATRSLGQQICMPKPNVPSCAETFYTVTTKHKTTTKVKPVENYRGISKTLKSIEEDKDLYYIYVDEENAVIHQYHVDAGSTRKIHREAYKLNMKTCQYEVIKKDKLVKNMGGSPVLKSEDAGWGFEESTKIYVDLPSSEEILSFSWGRLHNHGYYSAAKKYKKEIPQIVKTMMGKVNDMATQLRNETKDSKEINIFKSLYDTPGTPRDVQCGGKVAMESLLIPSLDGTVDPDIEFKINIRLSTPKEIKIMKAYMKNGTSRPDMMIKALQMIQGETK